MNKLFSIALVSFCLLAKADKLTGSDELMIAAQKLSELNWLLQNNDEYIKGMIVERHNEEFVNKREMNSQYNDTLCQSQLLYLFDGLNRSASYALQVFDAWGRLPSGILSGNTYDFGNFDQCLEISHQSNTDNVGLVRGQYCLITAKFSSAAGTIFKDQNTGNFQNLELKMLPDMDSFGQLKVSLGICMPAQCSPEYIKQMANSVLEIINSTTSDGFKQGDHCHVKGDIHLTTIDWWAIFFFGVIGLLMVSSTLYEIYAHQLQKPQILILKAFSVYTNSKKLFTTHKPTSPDHVGCINGIRVLSILWVVFCHSYLHYTTAPLQNAIYLIEWISHYSSMLVVAGTVSVDTFFLMSGMLLTMSALKDLDRNGKLNLPVMYIHRYLRLTPAFGALILFSSSLIRYAGSGPIWRHVDMLFVKPCHKYWWSTLLYVQNYVNPNEICLGHSWYLSVDMQLYFVSPLLLYPLWRYGKKFIAIIGFLIVAAMSCVFATMSVKNYRTGWTHMDASPDRMKLIYYPTHIRIHAWLIGVLLGYTLHLNKQKRIHLSKIFITTAWCCSLAIICTVIFGAFPLEQLDYNGPFIVDALYESTSRVFWAAAVGWIIFACINGYGGIVNSFLSLTVWQPLGKLSYSIYLVHMVVQGVMTSTLRHSRYFSTVGVLHTAWGELGLTLTICVLWSLAFESPIVVLEKYLFRALKPKPKLLEKMDEQLPSTQSQEQLVKSTAKEC